MKKETTSPQRVSVLLLCRRFTCLCHEACWRVQHYRAGTCSVFCSQVNGSGLMGDVLVIFLTVVDSGFVITCFLNVDIVPQTLELFAIDRLSKCESVSAGFWRANIWQKSLILFCISSWLKTLDYQSHLTFVLRICCTLKHTQKLWGSGWCALVKTHNSSLPCGPLAHRGKTSSALWNIHWLY